MATIVQGGPDLRFAVLEQGVSRGVENYFQERERAKKEQRFLDAFAAVNAATSYEDAVKAVGLADKEVLMNPAAMQILNGQIERRFPPQEGTLIETPEGTRTVVTRKGDVAGAIAQAQAQGGRLESEAAVEQQKSEHLFDREYQQALDKEKLSLEERRVKALEQRAQILRSNANKPPKPSEKDKEIDRIATILGGDPSDYTRATKIVYGLEQTSVNPTTGEVEVLDKITGNVAIVPQEVAEGLEKVPSNAEGKTLWNAALAGTGPFSALRASAALPTSYMGVFVPEKTVEARQQLELSTQRLVRALAANPRFPATELERIRKEFALNPSIWVHPETLRRRMVTVNNELDLWLAQANRDSQDRTQPPQARAEAKQSAAAIRNFISELGIPEEHRRGETSSIEQVPESVQTRYPQITWSQWQRLTPEQKRRLQGE